MHPFMVAPRVQMHTPSFLPFRIRWIPDSTTKSWCSLLLAIHWSATRCSRPVSTICLIILVRDILLLNYKVFSRPGSIPNCLFHEHHMPCELLGCRSLSCFLVDKAHFVTTLSKLSDSYTILRVTGPSKNFIK